MCVCVCVYIVRNGDAQIITITQHIKSKYEMEEE